MQEVHFVGPVKPKPADAPYLPIRIREQLQQHTKHPNLNTTASTQAAEAILNGWKDDPRMVFLANPGRDLTPKERREWERNITQYQLYYYPPNYHRKYRGSQE